MAETSEDRCAKTHKPDRQVGKAANFFLLDEALNKKMVAARHLRQPC
jgi:hypothetical protein